MSSLNNKNFKIISDELNKQRRLNEQQAERIKICEGNIATLYAELTNLKQLVGHVVGRGMGPTT